MPFVVFPACIGCVGFCVALSSLASNSANLRGCSIPTRGISFFFFSIPLNTLLTLNHLWLKLYNLPVILMFLVGIILKLRLKHILFLCGEPSFGGFNYLTDTVGKVPKKAFWWTKRTPKRPPKNQTVRVILISDWVSLIAASVWTIRQNGCIREWLL